MRLCRRYFAILRSGLPVLSVSALCLGAAVASADESKSPANPATQEAGAAVGADQEVRKLIAEFDSDQFQARQQATRRLVEIGLPAVEPLVDAAMKGTAEQGLRAVGVLEQLSRSEDEAVRDASRAGLERLGKDGGESVAARAKKAIHAEAPPLEGATPAEEFPFPLPGGFPGGAAVKAVKVSVQNINGVKTMHVEDGDATFSIHEDPADGITITKSEEVTEGGETKTKSTEYRAKNAEELKEKHPEAHEIYAKYGSKGAGGASVKIELPGGGIVIGDAALPKLPFPFEQGGEKARRKLDATKDQLRAVLDELKRQSSNEPLSAESLKKIVEQLESASKEIEDLSNGPGSHED